jgi:tetratricopeptide (TPR) repeat protein
MGSLSHLNTFKSKRLLEDGKFHLSTGDLDQAIASFQISNEVKESADALTYLGWDLSLKGQIPEAKDLCMRAISIDPDFGNAYNDLGSYLIKEDRLLEAIPWLEKAKLAKRYDARHFPHMNLGRIYSTLGRIDDAITEFNKALEYVPGHREVLNVLEQLQNLKKSEVNA